MPNKVSSHRFSPETISQLEEIARIRNLSPTNTLVVLIWDEYVRLKRLKSVLQKDTWETLTHGNEPGNGK